MFYLKRIGHIYENIYDLDNILDAMREASKEKRNQKRVKVILENDIYYAKQIQKLLVNKSYVPTKPQVKTIQDASSGKVRTIYKPNFYPDQIVHWSLMLQIEPIIMRGMYQYSCGSIPGRGTSFGQNALRRWMDKDRKNTKYCLKMDIEKYYPSINNKLLKIAFRRKIKDRSCLWLINIIIDSHNGQPIGFYTSQWFSNFFLEAFDHFIKQKLKVKYYIRYVDDLVLLGGNKRKLHKVKKEIEAFLSKFDLKLKDDWQVFRTAKRPIDFLGIKFYQTHSTLRKRNALRITRRMRKIKRKDYLNEKDASAIISYWGWIKRTDSWYFYHKYVKPVASIKLAKKVVSINAKIRNNKKRVKNQRPYVARL